MENKTLEILIVEDNPKHLADAKAFMDAKIAAGVPVKVDYATNLKEALQCIDGKAYDGIICDIFFPSGGTAEDEKQAKWKAGYEILGKEDIRVWQLYIYSDGPLGVIVAEKVKDKIPLVFCTDTHHHGKKTEPINQYTGGCGMIVDSEKCENWDGDLQSQIAEKNWQQAYECIISSIAVKKYYNNSRKWDEVSELIDSFEKIYG